MDNIIDNFEIKSINKGKYQYLILFISFFIFATQEILYTSMSFLEERPDITIKDYTNKSLSKNSIENFLFDDEYTIRTFKITQEFCVDYNKKLNNEKTSFEFSIIKVHELHTSIASEYNFFCNEYKLAILNLISFSGAAVGYALSPIFNNIFGRKKTIIIYQSLMVLSCLILANFNIFNYVYSNNYYTVIISSFLFMLCSVVESSTIYLYMIEILCTDLRSLFANIMLVGYPISIAINVSLLIIFNNWKILYYFTIICGIIIIILSTIFLIESPKVYLERKDYKNYIISWHKISAINIGNFFQEFYTNKKNTSYLLSNYTSFIEEIQSSNINLLPQAEYNTDNCFVDINSEKETQKIIKNNNNNNASIDIKSNSDNNLSQNCHSLINSLTNNNKLNESYYGNSDYNKLLSKLNEILLILERLNKKCLTVESNIIKKRSWIDLVKYKSLRYKFLTINFSFLVSIGSYYSLSIALKNLPVKSMDVMGYIDSLIQIIVVFSYSFLIDLKAIGRKGMMLGGFVIVTISNGLLAFFSESMSSLLNVILYFSTKSVLCVITSCIYVVVVEIYPTTLRKYGLNIGFFIGKIGAITFSALIEVSSRFVINLCFFIICLITSVLYYIFIDETLGKPLKDDIEEFIKIKPLEIENENIKY